MTWSKYLVNDKSNSREIASNGKVKMALKIYGLPKKFKALMGKKVVVL